MKKKLYIVLLLISITAFSQNKTLEITNIKSGKVKFFKENQRIKIRTLDGKKHIGNLTISDSQAFMVNNESVKIDSLKSIKNHPKGLATVKTVLLAAGLATIASSLYAAAEGSDSAFLLFTVGAGITISSGVVGNQNSNNSNYKWRFKIVEK